MNTDKIPKSNIQTPVLEIPKSKLQAPVLENPTSNIQIPENNQAPRAKDCCLAFGR
jgi:hypothetical protein